MILPQTAEYALRAMAQLALTPPGRRVRSADLSELTHIPEPYLAKVLQKLVAQGLLRSEKGHHGGFTLALPKERIRFLDILKAVDFDLEPDRCAFGWKKCSAKNPCALHPAFAPLKNAYVQWAAATTLADLGPDGSPR